MKIAVVKDQQSLSQTIALGDSYRYLSIMPTFGFQTVSFWRGRGLESLNYCGQGYTDFNCAMLPCSAFTYSGDMVKLTIGMNMFVSNANHRTFRWGVALFRADNSYLGWQPVSALGLIEQGTFTPAWNNGNISYQSFDCYVNVPTGLPFYVYLWRGDTAYGNIHITSNINITASFSGQTLAFYDATPYIYQNGIWQQATAKVYSGGWK